MPTNSEEPSQLAPVDALVCSVSQFQAACDRMAAAIEDCNGDDASRAADDALSSWLISQSWLRRIEPDANAQPRVEIARYAVRANRLALATLLERAAKQLPAPVLERILGELRVRL